MERDELIELLAVPGSPYSRKLIAYLRYRRLRHAVHWGGHHAPPAGYPEPDVKLLPTVYFGTGASRSAMTDTTPVIRRLEARYEDRAALPDDPAIGFLNDLIEDYADEWVTKIMFHYRWAFDEDACHAGPLLAYWSMPTLPKATAEAVAQRFMQRQINRLGLVGSDATTAETIEASFLRLLDVLDDLIVGQGYLLGRRPASSDFALFGQLTQPAQVEPTPMRIVAGRAPRVRAWVDRVEDLSGLEPTEEDWIDREEACSILGPLLGEIGRVYTPFLIANADAANEGRESFETEIDGRPWTQPTFRYQVKCLGSLRTAFTALSRADQETVREFVSETGCEPLLP